MLYLVTALLLDCVLSVLDPLKLTLWLTVAMLVVAAVAMVVVGLLRLYPLRRLVVLKVAGHVVCAGLLVWLSRVAAC